MKKLHAYRQRGKDAMFKVWHASPTGILMYVHEGEGGIVFAEKTYPLEKGALCFIGKGRYHYTMPNDSESYDRSKLFLPSEPRFSSLFSSLRVFEEDGFAYALLKEEDRVLAERIFAEASAASAEDIYGEPLLLSAALQLFVLLDRYAPEEAPRAEGFMSQAVEFINRELENELTVDAICAAVHISKYHFCRRFKQTMGMTVMEYVLKTRIARAKSYLNDDALSVTEIALRCGFGSPAYFSRVFKEETGKSPLRYRKSPR